MFIYLYPNDTLSHMGIITELLRGVVLVVEGKVCPNYQIHVHMGMDVSTSGPQVYGTCLQF